MERKIDLRRNIHYWLRKVWLFVEYAEEKVVSVPEDELFPEEVEVKSNPSLGITKDDAKEALDNLYDMLSEPLAINGCIGGKPRRPPI